MVFSKTNKILSVFFQTLGVILTSLQIRVLIQNYFNEYKIYNIEYVYIVYIYCYIFIYNIFILNIKMNKTFHYKP